MSSNPFRKKAPQAIDTTTRVQSPVKSSLRSESPLGSAASGLGKPRTVKKVRVLSPPPLSPASPEWTDDGGRGAYADSLYRDPFGVGWSADEASDTALPVAVPPGSASAPANPFSKTPPATEDSKDLEKQRKSEGVALKAGNMARQSLNVDSFKRLLLTGNINGAESLLAGDSAADKDSPVGDTPKEQPITDKGEGDEESSTSEISSAANSDDHEGPVSGLGLDGHAAKDKKPPPPPPSSRHGKSLRDDGSDALKLGPSTDVHKPLPPSPARANLDGAVSPFDRESAGKVPEQQPEREPDVATPTPEARRESVVPTSGVRRSAPAPPPRRSHARAGSKSTLSAGELTPSRRRGDEVTAGAFSDDASARSDEPRHAPLPPPPRRPHATSRQVTPTSSQVTPVPPSPAPQLEADHPAPADTPGAAANLETPPASAKLVSPPPRPPTRNPSIRRPQSAMSVDGLSRRVSVENKTRDGPARPPPPPPRQRGGSSGSLDVQPQQTSGEVAAPDPGKGDDILADLDALQREVDALRGQMS